MRTFLIKVPFFVYGFEKLIKYQVILLKPKVKDAWNIFINLIILVENVELGMNEVKQLLLI